MFDSFLGPVQYDFIHRPRTKKWGRVIAIDALMLNCRLRQANQAHLERTRGEFLRSTREDCLRLSGFANLLDVPIESTPLS
jgi:hypothetical protein